MKKKLIRLSLILLAIGTSFAVVVVVGTFTSIYSSVSKTCNHAKIENDTGCVDAMITTLESEDTSITDKSIRVKQGYKVV